MAWLFAASAALAAASAPVAESAPPAENAPASNQGVEIILPHGSQSISLTGDVEVIELAAERYDRFTLEVMIGERGPFDFLIDTGSQATVLAREIADRLGLHERQPAMLIGMASTVAVEVARVPDLTIGSRIVDVHLAPLLERSNIGGADGILGLDSLQGQRVLLDFEAQTIAVATADDLGGDRGFEIVVKAHRKLGQLVITRAEIDGVRTAVIVDTGAQGSVGNLALGRKLRGRDLGATSMMDVNGFSVEGQMRLARVLSMGGIELRSFPVAFADAPPFEALGLQDEPALIIGIRELKLFRRVAIDFEARKVLFDLASGTVRSGRPASRIYGF